VGAEPPEGLSAAARDEGGGSARRFIRLLGREVAVSRAKVLIPPPTMIRSRATGQAAEEDLMEGGTL